MWPKFLRSVFCSLPAFSSAVIQLVFRHLSAERVAVNPQNFRSAQLVAVHSLKNAFDKSFFKFTHGFVEQYAAFYHLRHKPFQLISHFRTLQTYFFQGAAS
jgi:hypothetical protein